MEGLVSSRANLVYAYGRKYQYRFLPSSTLQLRKSIYEFRLKTIKQSSPFNVTVASVQPVRGSKVSHSGNNLPSGEILELWRNADAVCFDVDSTICLDEGIDELADFCGAGHAVAEWTARAMAGSVPFEDALAARLSLFSPSLSQVQDCLSKDPPDAMFLFSLGISFGMIASTMANEREVDNFRGLLKQTENLVQDLQEELEMKDSVSVKELHNENYGPQDMCGHSFYEKDMTWCSPEKHIGVSPINNNKELHDHREEESPRSMSKIEAELEAELERLGLTMNTSTLEGRLSEFAELVPEFEADFVQGELRTDMVSEKALAHRKSNDDASDIATPLSTSYAVSHHELSLRLHEVIQSRLEQRVKELEIAFESSQRKVQMMESKLNGHYEWDHPLVVNLSGEALDAYNEAYEELVKTDYAEENSPSGIYGIGPKEGSHSHGWRALGNQLGEANCSVAYSKVNAEILSGETTSNQVTMLEGQSSGVSKLNVNGDENCGIDCEMELIRKIVERTKKGSPVFQNAQKILDSMDEDEI